jgi:hypothetical protein
MKNRKRRRRRARPGGDAGTTISLGAASIIGSRVPPGNGGSAGTRVAGLATDREPRRVDQDLSSSSGTRQRRTGRLVSSSHSRPASTSSSNVPGPAVEDAHGALRRAGCRDPCARPSAPRRRSAARPRQGLGQAPAAGGLRVASRSSSVGPLDPRLATSSLARSRHRSRPQSARTSESPLSRRRRTPSSPDQSSSHPSIRIGPVVRVHARSRRGRVYASERRGRHPFE